MLSIQNLGKTYPNGVHALKYVSLEIPPGMFGLLGPNGAGKSSLMRTIATLQLPDRGSIRFDDLDVLADPAYLSNTDLRLRDGSPMIDAGDDRSAPSHLLFDRRGNARRTGRIDIGAFERPLPSRNP